MLSKRATSFLVVLPVLLFAQLHQSPRVVPPTGTSQLPAQRPAPRLRAGAALQTTPAQASGVNFAPAVAYDSGGYDAISVSVADVNGDGNPDIVISNTCYGIHQCNDGTVGVLLENDDGTFQAAVTYPTGGYAANHVTIADVNRDGKPDLVVANACDNNACDFTGSGIVGVLLGNGDGTFQPAVIYNSGGYSAEAVAVADVNGDGIPDLVVSNSCAFGQTVSCGTAPGSVSVLFGNGHGTFQPAVIYNSGLGVLSLGIAVADVSGDGKADLVVSGGSSVFVILNNGDGTFRPAVAYGAGGLRTYSVVIADVNVDGKPDLVAANDCADSNCANGSVGVLLGNGDGTFQTAVSYDSGGQNSVGVAVADVNGDGTPDLVVANECGTVGCGLPNHGSVGVLLGNGDGTFQTAIVVDSGGYNPISVDAADLNQNGKPGVVVANECGSGQDTSCGSVGQGSVGVLINTSLTATTTVLASSQNRSNLGQPVILTATVTAQQGFYKGTPTGTVTFTYGSTTLCNAVTLSDVTASCTYAALPVGSDIVTAAYSGNSNFAPSSDTVSQTVDQAIVAISGSPQQPLTLNSSGDLVAFVTITNTGNITIASAQVTIAGTTLGSASLLAAPPPVTNLAPGASATITLTFPDTAALSKATTAPLKVSGTYSVPSVPLSGNWGLSFRSVSLSSNGQRVYAALCARHEGLLCS